jgi:hypothetical protein
MIRKCEGNCGKMSTVQPWADSRFVYFLCSVCASKRAEKVFICGVEINLSPRGEIGRHTALKMLRR